MDEAIQSSTLYLYHISDGTSYDTKTNTSAIDDGIENTIGYTFTESVRLYWSVKVTDVSTTVSSSNRTIIIGSDEISLNPDQSTSVDEVCITQEENNPDQSTSVDEACITQEENNPDQSTSVVYYTEWIIFSDHSYSSILNGQPTTVSVDIRAHTNLDNVTLYHNSTGSYSAEPIISLTDPFEDDVSDNFTLPESRRVGYYWTAWTTDDETATSDTQYITTDYNNSAPIVNSYNIYDWDNQTLWRDRDEWKRLEILVTDDDGYSTIDELNVTLVMGDDIDNDKTYAFNLDVDLLAWSYITETYVPIEIQPEATITEYTSTQAGYILHFKVRDDIEARSGCTLYGNAEDDALATSGQTALSPTITFDDYDGGDTPGGPGPGSPGDDEDDEPYEYEGCELTEAERINLYRYLETLTVRELREYCDERGIGYKPWRSREPYYFMIFIVYHHCPFPENDNPYLPDPDDPDYDPDNDVDDDGVPDDEDMDPYNPFDDRRKGPLLESGAELFVEPTLTWIQQNSIWLLILLFLVLLLLWLSREGNKPKNLGDILKPLYTVKWRETLSSL